MEAKLVVVGGEAPEGEYALSLPIIVGRSRTADIKLGHPLVSRKHCEMYEAEGQLVVRDLGSLNGTFVGESRISDATFLPPGSTVTIGSVTFQAVYGDQESAAQVDSSELPDFLAAAPPNLVAGPIEQTIEIENEPDTTSELNEAESPATEAVAQVDGETGFDFGWLEEPGDDNEEEPAASAGVAPTQETAAAEESAELDFLIDAPEAPVDAEPAAGHAQPAAELELHQESLAEDDLPLPEAPEVSQNGVAHGGGDEFAAPEKQTAASADDDDLNDFFASLK